MNCFSKTKNQSSKLACTIEGEIRDLPFPPSPIPGRVGRKSYPLEDRGSEASSSSESWSKRLYFDSSSFSNPFTGRPFVRRIWARFAVRSRAEVESPTQRLDSAFSSTHENVLFMGENQKWGHRAVDEAAADHCFYFWRTFLYYRADRRFMRLWYRAQFCRNLSGTPRLPVGAPLETHAISSVWFNFSTRNFFGVHRNFNNSLYLCSFQGIRHMIFSLNKQSNAIYNDHSVTHYWEAPIVSPLYKCRFSFSRYYKPPTSAQILYVQA